MGRAVVIVEMGERELSVVSPISANVFAKATYVIKLKREHQNDDKKA